MFIVSETVDDSVVNRLESRIDWFMTELQKMFKIANRGFMKKNLNVEWEWGTQSDGKTFFKATMDKKVAATTRKYKDYNGREAKCHESTEK